MSYFLTKQLSYSQLSSILEHSQSVKTVRSTLHQSWIPNVFVKRQKVSNSFIEEEVNQLFEPSQESSLPIDANDIQCNYSSDDLIHVKDYIPPLYQSIIPFEYFNRIQSKVCDSILQSNTNIVISAPTVIIPASFHFIGMWKDCDSGVSCYQTS